MPDGHSKPTILNIFERESRGFKGFKFACTEAEPGFPEKVAHT
jgi:hypothetical protein